MAKGMRCSVIQMGGLTAVMVLLSVVVPQSRAQQAETCNETTVRQKSEKPVPEVAADDIYVNSTNSKLPVTGKEEFQKLRSTLLAARKNIKPTHYFPERIVPSKSGDMAYDYGKAHVEYDLANTGQHISYDFEYLRVWKVSGGVCRLSASFSRAERLAGTNN